jgi:hypothetical protein
LFTNDLGYNVCIIQNEFKKLLYRI